jgi:hypothetical protein
LADNTAITNDVSDVLSENNIPTGGAAITIQVNNQAVDANTAKQNDKISVKVSIPVSQVSWTTTFLFLSSPTVESESVVMLRRG